MSGGGCGSSSSTSPRPSRRLPSSPLPEGSSSWRRWPRCCPSAFSPARSRGRDEQRCRPRWPTPRSGLLAPATYLRDEAPELLVGRRVVLASAVGRHLLLELGEHRDELPRRGGVPLHEPHERLEHRGARLGLLVRQVVAERLDRL